MNDGAFVCLHPARCDDIAVVKTEVEIEL